MVLYSHSYLFILKQRISIFHEYCFDKCCCFNGLGRDLTMIILEKHKFLSFLEGI